MVAGIGSIHGADISGGRDQRPANANTITGGAFYDTDLRTLLASNAGVLSYPPPVINDRFELLWKAGQRGKPGINGDILSATAAVRMIADPDFEILGTNHTSALCTFNAEGGLTLTTAGADGDIMVLAPHLDANQSAWTQVTWGTDKEVAWHCRLATAADITLAAIWAGLKLTNTSVTATDDDQVFVRYEDDVNSGKWQGIYSIGGTDTATDSGITVAASTKYDIVIMIDSDRLARILINGTLVATSTALTDATDLIPYLGVEADGEAAAKAITIYGQGISRNSG